MDLRPDGHWAYLDYHDYGDEVLDDADFAKAYRDRDPAAVVTRQMIEDGPAEEHGADTVLAKPSGEVCLHETQYWLDRAVLKQLNLL